MGQNAQMVNPHMPYQHRKERPQKKEPHQRPSGCYLCKEMDWEQLLFTLPILQFMHDLNLWAFCASAFEANSVNSLSF